MDKGCRKMKSKSKKILLIIAAVIAVIAVATAVVNYAVVKSDIKNAESFERVVIEDQLVPEKDANGYWTFTTDRELKVLQLTDVHLGGGYLSVVKDRMALNCVAAMVAAEKPDLVVVSGDIDGNGILDITDIMRMKSGILEGSFSGTGNVSMKLAADLDGNGSVDTTDYMRLKGHFLGNLDLF